MASLTRRVGRARSPWIVRAALVALVCATPLRGQPQSLVYSVKAGFLFNFLRFIEWPAAAFKGPDQPFRLCIIGEDPFGPALDGTGEVIAGRRVVVERLKHEESSTSCHLVFVPASDFARLPTVVKLTNRKGILVVGETKRALEACAGIALDVEAEHVRFDVSLPALRSHQLVASSRLLRVSRDHSFTPARCRF